MSVTPRRFIGVVIGAFLLSTGIALTDPLSRGAPSEETLRLRAQLDSIYELVPEVTEGLIKIETMLKRIETEIIERRTRADSIYRVNGITQTMLGW